MATRRKTPYQKYRFRIVGLFPDKGEAEQAIRLLHGMGLGNEQIGVMAKDDQALIAMAKEAGAIDRRNPELGELKQKTHRGWDEFRGAILGGVICGLLFAALSMLIPGFGLVSPAPLTVALILAVGAGSGLLIGIGIGSLLGAIQDERTLPDRREFYADRMEKGDWVVVAQDNRKHPEELAERLKEVGAESVDIYG